MVCRHCGDEFEPADNYLRRNEVCPQCFQFPDVASDEPSNERATVYLAARVQHGMHGIYDRSYYRVAAESAPDARWLVEAFVALDAPEDEQYRRKQLLALEVDDDGVANTRMRPRISVGEAVGDDHDGYAVQKLGYRSHTGDEERQRDLGPNTTDQLRTMDADDYQDVLVHASEEEIEHKLRENVPDGHECYWTVNGTPRQTRFGQRIWFEADGEIVAAGQIKRCETGRIWFTPLERVDAELPKEPPTRGFRYIEPLREVADA